MRKIESEHGVNLRELKEGIRDLPDDATRVILYAIVRELVDSRRTAVHITEAITLITQAIARKS